MSFKVVIFVEGAFYNIEELPDLATADGFAMGLSTGASLYGAGSCAGYVIPGDEDAMSEHQDPYQIAHALNVLNKN